VCTYTTEVEAVDGSAKGPGGRWFHVSQATVYFDHPVHAQAGHTLNIDLADPSRGPSARVGIELTAASARALASSIAALLDGLPAELVDASDARVTASPSATAQPVWPDAPCRRPA
jgi:Family of unknown function (DUF6295)